MDRQKSIPPLSTKITRKLAQESADHNTLMNFYSQISRDETGAPKKWKMSSNLHIDEDSIKSKKSGTTKGSSTSSNKETPSSSRENSNERKSRLNQSLLKASRKGSLNRDGSSSEQSSSRESSLEGKGKSEDKKDKNFTSRFSDFGKHRNSLDTNSSTAIEKVKKKRGRRPKSLDLSSKEMANGDDDNFKSPVPLTPCNIAIKRKKGRPKETPPTLYAEPPVETSPLESDKDYESEEDSSPPLKRGPGRPRKIKKFNTNQLKSLRKVEKNKPFNMKQYGSKIIKSNLPKGFRRMNKFPTLKSVMTSNDNNKDDGSMASNESDDYDKVEVKENGIGSVKRKPGRPPGAKNKKFYSQLAMLKTRAKSVKPIVSKKKAQFGSHSLKKAMGRGPGRPPGAKNKTTLQKIVDKTIGDKIETISNSSKENNAVAEKEEIPVEFKNENESSVKVDGIDEAIEAVLFRARNDMSLESNVKSFRTSGFYRKLSSVKSVAKFKKEKDKLHKIRKRRILESHASAGEIASRMESLASNDLRRKLQSKLMQKIKAGSAKTSGTEVFGKAEETVQYTENLVKDASNKTAELLNSGTVSDHSHIDSEEPVRNVELNENIPPATLEEKIIIKPDTMSSIEFARNVRKQNFDVAKFSDTESVCSELSTNSFGSLKRNIEKQVLILGEDNLESDDQTVRTRQRFEIIPGKKRKRTLSGEFDLLDEKQLRKERKKAGKGQTDDEADIHQIQTITPLKKPLFKRKKSPLKKSPNLKVKDGKIVKKYVSQLTAYRNRMLKQSPFLSRVRKKRRKPLVKRTPEKKMLENIGKEALKTESINDGDKGSQDSHKNQTEGSEEKVETSTEFPAVKSENYRQGLFEKFTDVTLESKENSMKNVEVSSIYAKSMDDVDSDDTESTIELNDDILNEEHEELPIEESVDDSDTINFHAEEESESSSKELYTESEIEIREMLFDLFDEVVNKFVSKSDFQGEITNVKCDEKKEVKSCKNIVEAVSESNGGKTPDCQTFSKENLFVKVMKTDSKSENESPCDESNAAKMTEKLLNSNAKVLSKECERLPERDDEKGLKTFSNEKIEVETSITKLGDISVNNDKELAVVGQVEENPIKKPRMKYKVRRKRYVPLSLSKKKQASNDTETKVRKKPGRKPKQKKEEDYASSLAAVKETLNDKQANPVESKSPETGVMRKFELRQKISRSPLDNIALKQSLEENEYLRNEAQKLYRKEAKFKLKSKTLGQESLESSPKQSKEIESTEIADSEVNASAIPESMIDTEIETIENLLKSCRPCKVILKDFIKELERAQAQTESSCESDVDTQESKDNSDEEKCSSPKIIDTFETNIDVSESNENLTQSVPISSLTKELHDEIDKVDNQIAPQDIEKSNDKTDDNEVCAVKESIACDQMKSVDNSVIPKSNEINEKGENVNDSLGQVIEAASPNAKQRELRPKRKTPVKNENISPIKLAKSPPKKIRKTFSSNEQQTARKTVPPLKIKVKGGFSSRRKTYIVEPSPDSPVEQSSKNEQKSEKKKEKNKLKSGNKSESSDSEKHSKNHHHRKKIKTPSEEISFDQNKTTPIQMTDIAANVVPEKPTIKPTDAYEANFLQFIQDKDKVEQNIAAFSNSLGPRNKTGHQHFQKILQKENIALSSSPVAFKESVPTEVNKVSFTSTLSDSQNEVDNSDVQYVCSQCDNIVYKSKEQIVQHYREIHPGSQFIYKPLPESNENIITSVGNYTQQGPETETRDSAIVENTIGPTSFGENEAAPDDDDSGSLNLKIVDVVSLKDQENLLDADSSMTKIEQVTPMNTVQTNQIQTQLRIPSYPILSSAPPLYSVIGNVPPPPYSMATAGAQLQTISALQEQLQLKSKPASLAQKSQKTPGKIGNSFKCEKCNVHAPMLAAMVAHLRNSHKEIPRLFQCPYCKDMEAETEALIHQHIKKHHPTNNPNPPVALSEPAKRNLKTLSVKLPEGYKLGEGTSIEKDIYMCLKCKEHMPSLETIYEHLEHEHAEIFAYVCPDCKIFKSKSEELVNNHIITTHHRRPGEINVSLAIDGNHFVRVQCLVKDKAKSGQKSAHSIQQKQQISPVATSLSQSKPAVLIPGLSTVIPQAVVPQGSQILSQSHSVASPLNTIQQTNSNFAAPPVVSKSSTGQGQKKKKSLLESIQKIKVQKMEQQGLLPQKSAAPVSIPSHPSQLNSIKSNVATGAVPPPLMRGPPPLIRYDQLNKVTSPQAVMFGSTVRTSSQLTLQNQAGLTSLQRLQNITSSQNSQSVTGPARPIQSALFDTSELAESVKSPQSQRPVLNVPVVSRLSNKSPFAKAPSTSSTPDNIERTATGSPLDLSKTTPSASPVPQNILPINFGQIQASASGGINPDMFQVFNLRPSTQMQLPRPQVQAPQMIAQPIMFPQQVRQNTPSTLAYRPPGSQMIATSQVQQLIGMPVNALIGNMVVSLGSVTQGIPAMPIVNTALQNAQLVRMSTQSIPASTVAVFNTNTAPTANQVQTKNSGVGQPILSKGTLCKCPYCPNITPLRFDQVQTHIENKHPGSTVLFKPFDSR